MILPTGCPGWTVRIAATVHAPSHQFVALLDTGASHCCVSPKIVDQLELETLATTGYASASASEVSTTLHKVHLTFTLSNGTEVRIPNLQVTKLGRQPDEFDFIIGMNVLKEFKLVADKGHPSITRNPLPPIPWNPEA